MGKKTALSGILALLFSVGCYQPDLSGPGQFNCSELDPACPEDFHCDTAAKICVKNGSTPTMDTTVDTTVDGGPPPDGLDPVPTWVCEPLGEFSSVQGGGEVDFAVGEQFGLFREPTGDLWASFKEAPSSDGIGVLSVFKKAQGPAAPWTRVSQVGVGREAGAHSDILAFKENNQTKAIVVLQAQDGLAIWGPTADGIPSDNVQVIHPIEGGGHFPAMLPTGHGLGIVHGVSGTDDSGIWYLVPDELPSEYVVAPKMLDDLGSNSGGLPLAAVRTPGAMPGDQPMAHLAYYAGVEGGTALFANHTMEGVEWEYLWSDDTPARGLDRAALGIGLALDGTTPMVAYIDDNDLPAGRVLRFGVLDNPVLEGEEVPFPGLPERPSLAIGNGHVAILAVNQEGIPLLVFRPAGEQWLPPVPINQMNRDLKVQPETQTRILVTEHGDFSLSVIVGYLATDNTLRVGEFQCRENFEAL